MVYLNFREESKGTCSFLIFAGSRILYTVLAFLPALPPVSDRYIQLPDPPGQGPQAMSSQSFSVAPSIVIVAKYCPAKQHDNY